MVNSKGATNLHQKVPKTQLPLLGTVMDKQSPLVKMEIHWWLQKGLENVQGSFWLYFGQVWWAVVKTSIYRHSFKNSGEDTKIHWEDMKNICNCFLSWRIICPGSAATIAEHWPKMGHLCDIYHRTKKCHCQSEARLQKCREIHFWYILCPFWLPSNWTPSWVPTIDDFWLILTQGRTGYLSIGHMSKHMLIGGINALPYSSHMPTVHIWNLIQK